MAQTDGKEAINAVIEKLTEIVEHSRTVAVTLDTDTVAPSGKAIFSTNSQTTSVLNTANPPKQPCLHKPERGEDDGVQSPAEVLEGTNELEIGANAIAISVKENAPPVYVTIPSQEDEVQEQGVHMSVLTKEPVVPSTSVASSVETDSGDSSTVIYIKEAGDFIETLKTVLKKSGAEQKKSSLVAQNTSSKDLLKCAKCSYQSHNKHYLKQHVDLVHNAERPFKCPFCDYAGKRSHSLKEHLVVHSTNRPYECPLCNASFRKKGHLTNHVRMHATQKVFECNVCHGKYEDRELLYKHLRADHEQDSVFACELCSYATTVKSNIIMHMHTHGNPKSYKCDVCSFTALHINIMKQHLSSHPAGATYYVETTNLKPRPVILLKCSECGFTTDDKEVLKNHMWDHVNKPSTEDQSESTKYESQAAGDPAKSKESNPEGTVYVCTDCKFQCKEAYTYITHMLQHKPRYPMNPAFNKSAKDGPTSQQPQNHRGFTHDAAMGMYRCLLCGYSCDQQRTIKAHIWKHSGHKDLDYPMFVNGPLSMYDVATINEVAESTQDSSGTSPLSFNLVNASSENADDQQQIIVLYDESSQEVKNISPGSRQHIILEKNAPDIFHALVASQQAQQGEAVQIDRSNHDISCNDGTDVMEVIIEATGSGSEHENALEIVEDDLGVPDSAKDYTLRKSTEDTVESCDTNSVVLAKTQEETDKACEEPLPMVSEDGPLGENQSKLLPAASRSTRSQLGKRKANKSPPTVEKVRSLKKAKVEPDTNVVVQTMAQVYTTPTIHSTGNSPRAASPRILEPATSTDMGNQQSKPDSSDEEIPLDVIDKQDGGINKKEQMVTLLSLLKKGPNINPAFPGVVSRSLASTNGSDSEECKSSNGDNGQDGKPKRGICSSLLAVIEQLREVSKSESDGEETAEGTGPKEGPTKVAKRRASSRRSSLDDDICLDGYQNVEKIGPDGQFRCKLCHYTSASTGLMKTHMRLHKTKKPFECSLCDYLAKDSEDLQAHMLQHCKVRTYQCKLCPSVFSYKSQLRAHMRAHNDKDPFACDHCDYETSNPVAFRNHMRVHTDKKGNKVCTLCNETFTDIEKHKEVCGAEANYTCKDCSFDSQDIDEFKKHMKIKHPHIYKCDKCDFTSTSSNEIRNHCNTCQVSHKEATPLQCDLCDFMAMSNRSLKSHMKRHVNDQRFVQQPLEQYKCNLCGYVCHHLPSLKSHMWRHASDKNYSYQSTNDVINAAFDFSTEKEVVPVQLPVSSSATAGSSGAGSIIKQRNIKANPLVTFRCCQCGFETVQKAALNAHMKTHMDIIKRTLEVNQTQFTK